MKNKKILAIIILSVGFLFLSKSPDSVQDRKPASIKKINFKKPRSISEIGKKKNYKAIGKIETMKGEVYIIRNNEKKIAVKNYSVLAKDSIVTKNRSFVKIKMIDGSVFSVSSNSKINISEYLIKSPNDKNVVIQLIRGLLRSNFKNKINNGYLLIKTKTAAMGVRGTEFLTTYDPELKSTQTLLLSGKVIVDTLKSKNKLYEMKPQDLITTNTYNTNIMALDLNTIGILKKLATSNNFIDSFIYNKDKKSINLVPIKHFKELGFKTKDITPLKSIFEKKKSVFFDVNKENIKKTGLQVPSSIKNQTNSKNNLKNDSIKKLKEKLRLEKEAKKAKESKEAKNKINNKEKFQQKSTNTKKDIVKELQNKLIDSNTSLEKKEDYINDLLDTNKINEDQYQKIITVMEDYNDLQIDPSPDTDTSDLEKEIISNNLKTIVEETNEPYSEITSDGRGIASEPELDQEQIALDNLKKLKINYKDLVNNGEEPLVTSLYDSTQYKHGFILINTNGELISLIEDPNLLEKLYSDSRPKLIIDETGIIQGVNPLRDSDTGKLLIHEMTGAPINSFLNENNELSPIPIINRNGNIEYIAPINENGNVILVPMNQRLEFINTSAEFGIIDSSLESRP